MEEKAKIGEKVPEFGAEAYADGKFVKVKSTDYKGKWIVLFFYPLDFTFVCPTEIRSFAKNQPEFHKLNAVVIGASTDSVHSHKAWIERDLPEVKYPILADTTHSVSKIFGVLKEDQGIAYRGTFLIDPEGILRYIVVSDLSVGRSVDETVRVLKALQSGELCPIEWKPGEKTLGKA
ncbi:MAG: peroxiredoxin [Candidatus Nanoarchaeia archaeon]